MVFMNWIVLINRAWIILTVVLFTGLVTVFAGCPRDVSTKANSCFTSYSFHIQNMHNSPYKLCCGVDVEILRAFCQSYTSAMTCVNNLKRGCPEDIVHTIDTVLNNVNGVRAELHELCSDDSIIENYAMYQTCFSTVGDKSEMCLQTHMNGSSNIKFLSKVNIKGMDKFCRDLRNTIECVRKSVKLFCGDEAAQLVHVLIKPMIRQSSDCDYSVINDQQKLAKRPLQGDQAYVRENHGSGKNGAKTRDKNMAGDTRQASAVILWMSICILGFLILPTIVC